MTRVLLCLVALTTLTVTARADDPTPVRRFGGCNKTGTLCAGPTAGIDLVGFAVNTGQFTTGIMPGAGYGVTLFANKWHSVGLSLSGAMRSTTDGADGLFSLTATFAEYLRLGVARDVIGATSTTPMSSSTILLFGLGMDLGPSTARPK